MKKKTIKILTIMGICLLMIFVLIILGLIIVKWHPKTTNENVQYKLTYQKSETSNDKYVIYKTKENKVIVNADTQPNCITAPCNRLNIKNELKFNEKNMTIVINFINSFFKNTNYSEINITDADIKSEDKNILYSIINNDESYLNTKLYTLKSNKYTIVTDEKIKTTRDDGGSYTSIIYEIDLNYNEVTKKEEIYDASIGKSSETKTNTLYSKKVDSYLYEKTIKIISEAIETKDINEEGNNYSYTITSEIENKEIYNLNTISKIKELLKEYDEYIN